MEGEETEMMNENTLYVINNAFMRTHPSAKSRIDICQDRMLMRIRVENETEDSISTISREFDLRDIYSNSKPLAFVANALEQAYEDIVHDNEEKEMTAAGFDLTAIASDFVKKHPDVYVRFHVVTELDYIQLRVETKDDLRVHRIIDRFELRAAEEPVAVITTILESAYNELMRKKQEEDIMPTKGNAMPVDNDYMLKMARCAVASWYNTHGGPRKIKPEDIYIVWFCKTLQNWKALCSTDIHDGMYYEVTYDGDKDAAYVDAYKKWDNQECLGENLRKDIWKLGATVGFIDGKE